MKLIPLTRGQFAMVDDADFEAVNQFKWHAQKSRNGFYAARTVRTSDGGKKTLFLHQFLMPGVVQIDHRDGNGLNNQRNNIRPATHRQNAQGACHKKKGASARFRGVCWDQEKKRWLARIQVNGKERYLGRFTDEIEAAHAYDSAAVFYFGEWASTNFDIGQITIT